MFSCRDRRNATPTEAEVPDGVVVFYCPWEMCEGARVVMEAVVVFLYVADEFGGFGFIVQYGDVSVSCFLRVPHGVVGVEVSCPKYVLDGSVFDKKEICFFTGRGLYGYHF